MKLFASIVLNVVKALVGGFVFAHLWNWFIVRKLGLPSLSYMEALGILMVITFPLLNMELNQLVARTKEEHPDLDAADLGLASTAMMVMLVYPITLGVAYVWHLIIG
jgi:hypothetical protein